MKKTFAVLLFAAVLAMGAWAQAVTAVLPAGLQTVEEEAFLGDGSLQWVVLPEGTRRVESRAFARCAALRGVELPASVEYIAPDAFEDSPLALIRAEEGSYAWRYAYAHGLAVLEEDGGITGKAGGKAFFRFVEGVLIISGTGATYNGTGSDQRPWSFLRGQIREIVVEDGMTALSLGALAGCENLICATIAPSVRSVSSNIFEGSPLLFIRAGEGSVGRRFAEENGIPCLEMGTEQSGAAGTECSYTIEDGVLTVSGAGGVADALAVEMQPWYPRRGELTRVVIEEPVARIGTLAFADCPALTSVSIPASVTEIAENAFEGLTEGAQIHGYAGTRAETWAREHGYAFCAHVRLTAQPEAVVSLYDGDVITVGVEATGDGLSYRWEEYFTEEEEWYEISLQETAREAAYTSRHFDDEDGYRLRCRVTDAYGGTVWSGETLLHFRKPVVITKFPSNTLCSVGETVTFEVEAAGDGLAYQWQVRVDGLSEVRLLGTEPTQSVVYDGNDRNWYQCVVTDAYGNSARTYAVLIETATTIDGPDDCALTSGEQASFQVSATGKGLQYQWQMYDATADRWKDLGASYPKTDTLTFAARTLNDGQRFRCKVTNADDRVQYSREATLTVAPRPMTLTDPQDAQVVNGSAASFHVVGTGLGLRYQWQTRAAGEKLWSDATEEDGARTDTLSVTAVPDADGREYRCVATDADGFQKTSAAARLTVVVPVDGLRLSRSLWSADVKDETRLSAIPEPAIASDQRVTWTSDDTEVVTVAYPDDDDGSHQEVILRCGVKTGWATVTATTADGGYTAACRVRVFNLTGFAHSFSAEGSLESEDASLSALFRCSGGTGSYRLEGTVYRVPPRGEEEVFAAFSSGEECTDEREYALSWACALPGAYYCTATLTDSSGCRFTTTDMVSFTRAATGIALSADTLTLNKGDTASLTAAVLPADATNDAVYWTVSDETVVSVEDGEITALAGGKAVVTAASEDGGFRADCAVTVAVPATGVSFGLDSLSLEVGGSCQLTPVFAPADTTETSVSAWTSSDPCVTVEDGCVTAVSLPADPSLPVVVTAATPYGEDIQASCAVYVTRTLTGLTLSEQYMELTRGESRALTAIFKPADTTQAGVSWSSGDETVARVSSAGVVSAAGPGSTVITAWSETGAFAAECTVVVRDTLAVSVSARNTVIEYQGAGLYNSGFDATVSGGVAPYTVRFTVEGETVFGQKATKTGFSSSYSHDVTFFRSGVYTCLVTVTDSAGHTAEARSDQVCAFEPFAANFAWSHEPVYKGDIGACEADLQGGLPPFDVKMEFYRVGQREPVNTREWSGSTKRSFALQTPFDELDIYFVRCIVTDASGRSYEQESSMVRAQPVLCTYIFASPYDIWMYEGDSMPVTIDVYPQAAEDKTINVICSDWDIVSFDENCVFALSPGTAELTFRSVDGGASASVTVTVLARPLPEEEPAPEGPRIVLLDLPEEYEPYEETEEREIVVYEVDEKHFDAPRFVDDGYYIPPANEQPDINFWLATLPKQGKHIVCFPLGEQNVDPYVESTLEHVGDLNGPRDSASIYPGDELYLLDVGRTNGVNWALVSYPAGKDTRKTAYIDLWQIVAGGENSTCDAAGDFLLSNKRGSMRSDEIVREGTRMHVIYEDLQYCQFFYRKDDGTYRVGWCTQAEKNGLVEHDETWPYLYVSVGCAKDYATEYINDVLRFNTTVQNTILDGKTAVFLIEGCGSEQGARAVGSTALHSGALCVVVGLDAYGQATILYENAHCTTIPDNPKGDWNYCKSYNHDVNGNPIHVPTLKDGVYRLRYCNHSSQSLGSYGAMKVWSLAGGNAAVLRWDFDTGTFYESTSGGINVHARTFQYCGSSSYSSVGCQLIGGSKAEYLAFAKATGIQPPNATTMQRTCQYPEKTEAGILIVDRSCATARVNLTSIYGEEGYRAITGK